MNVLETAIGWLAPTSCIGCDAEGMVLCAGCSFSGIEVHGERCGYCGRLSKAGRTCEHCRHLGGPHSVWISTNHRPLAQELIQTYKFAHLRPAGLPIASLMANTLLQFNEPAKLKAMDYLLVPLPTATSRLRQRGFDHSALLARIIARRSGLEYAQALGRLGQSRQVGALRQDRLTQQTGAYFAKQPRRLSGRNILLIDDVITTGGSLIAAAKSLRAAGANRVDALVFAKRL